MLSSHQLCVHGKSHPSPMSLQSNCGLPRRLFTLLCTTHLERVEIKSASSRVRPVLEHLTPTVPLPCVTIPEVDILQGLVRSVQHTLRCKSS